MFNEVIIWGMVNYPKLSEFFVYDTQIHGTKVSFDRDVFKELSPKNNLQFKYLKDIKKGDDLYKRLSKSQKQISQLINGYDKSVKKIKNNYLQVCREKIKDKYGDYNYNFKIIEYENYKTKSENKMNQKIENEIFPFGEMKGQKIKDLDSSFIKEFIKTNAYRKNKPLRDIILKYHNDIIKQSGGGTRKKHRTSKKNKKHTLHYFGTSWCGYCKQFNSVWNLFSKSSKYKKHVSFKKTLINDNNKHLVHMYDITSYPSLVLVKNNGDRIHYLSDDRNPTSLDNFLKANMD